MRLYKNTGAPIPLEDGTFIESGVIFSPTDDQLLRLAYKLEPVAEEPAVEEDLDTLDYSSLADEE